MAKLDDTVLTAMTQIPVWGQVVVGIVVLVDKVLEFAISQSNFGDEINCMRHEIGGIEFGYKIVPAIAIDFKRKLFGNDNTWGNETIMHLYDAAQACLHMKENEDGTWNEGMFIWAKIQEDVFDLFGNPYNSNIVRGRRESKMKLQNVIQDMNSGKFKITPIKPIVLNKEQTNAAQNAGGISPIFIGVGLVGLGLAIRSLRKSK